MSDQDTNVQTGGRRLTRILLILSLAVNVVVIGMFAGHMIQGDPSGGSSENQIRWIIKLVPEARRDDTREHFRTIRDDVRATYMQRGNHLTAIAAAIKAEPFSAEALELAMQTRRDGGSARQELVQQHLVSLLESFSDAERAEFAANLEGFLAKLRERSGG
ncbi:MAG: periplasmic heavy metal sensor [Pseudomonadota bacterium]